MAKIIKPLIAVNCIALISTTLGYKITRPDELSAGDQFGNAITTYGDKLAVGAYLTNGGGRVYTFNWNGTDWVKDSYFLHSDEDQQGDDHFGFSVSMYDDKLAVGAKWNDGGGIKRGTVYTYQWNGTMWNRDPDILRPSELQNHDYFGTSVSMYDNVLAIGAYEDDTEGTGRGAVYTYKWNNTAWNMDNNVIIPDQLNDNDNFGKHVSLYGNKLAVGSYMHSDVGFSRGAVFTFHRDGEIWIQDDYFLSPEALQNNDRFGLSFSMYDDKLAVGTHLDDGAGSNRGAVYTFQWNGTNWVQDPYIVTPNDLSDEDYFGYSVSIYNKTLVVGATNDDGTGVDMGIVYKYEWNGTNWIQDDEEIAPSELRDSDWFGDPVVVYNDKIVVGVRNDDHGGVYENKGVVYTFEIPGDTMSTQSPTALPTPLPTPLPTTGRPSASQMSPESPVVDVVKYTGFVLIGIDALFILYFTKQLLIA